MRLTTRILATSLLLTSGCHAFTASENAFDAGGIHFVFDGAYSGTFDAGGIRPIRDGAFVSFAGADIQDVTDRRPGYVFTYPDMRLHSFSPRTDTRGHQVWFTILGAERGTFTRTCGISSGGGTPPPCASIYFTFDDEPRAVLSGGSAPVFTLDSGTVTITALTRDRVRGTFSGKLRDYSATVPVILSITGGRFDLPVRRIP
ncbi:MAG TPA: hypothetical protein VE913_05740 [Longimicrobium sp.]|nr:hypothetical protein [Longimicrobium sp.]